MTTPSYLLAIDQGTTSSRAILFDRRGRMLQSASQEFPQYYPKPGWVEHDAEEIWASCDKVIRKVVRTAAIKPSHIAAIGITNQRETTILWDRKTLKPSARAIVWQCRRTSAMCRSPRLARREKDVRRKTGLVLDPYFSGTKIAWMLEHDARLHRRAAQGSVCFGTVDSWLMARLTGGRAHVTDMTNASRTLVFNIRKKTWDPDLLKLLRIPKGMLPEVQPSGSMFGTTAGRPGGLPDGIPVAAVLGDQQAALFGQGCYRPGTIKNTYGTGCFLVLNTGDKPVFSRDGLLTTLAADDRGRPIYALEGAIFMAGAVVQWLRDSLKVIKTSMETERRIAGLADTHGVYFVPAFTGLGAPYWDSEARGLICGLTRGADERHIIRAALESVAYQTRDVFDLMRKDSGFAIRSLRVDGGACANNFLMQFQADILNCRIVRPRVVESTAQGAAWLAGVTIGMFDGRRDLERLAAVDKEFRPRMTPAARRDHYDGWRRAVARARSGAESGRG